MISCFENWFLHFVAEYNTDAAGSGCGERETNEYERLPVDVRQRDAELFSVLHDNLNVCGARILPFRPRSMHMGRKLSVA